MTGPADSRVRAPHVKRRALLGLLSTGSLGGVLGAACGTGGDTGAAPATRTLAPTTVEVYYNHWGGRTTAPMEGVIVPALTARFPQITVELVQKNAIAALIAAVTAGQPPSIAYMGAAQVVTAVRGDLAVTLDDHLKAWGQANDFYPAALDQARWKGNLHGLPVVGLPNAYFWRLDLLQANGIQQPPKSLEESLDTVRRVARAEGGTVTRQGLVPRQPQFELFNALRGMGLPLARGGKSIFNGPEGLAMLQYQIDRGTLNEPPGAATQPVQGNPLGLGAWAGGYGHYANLVNETQVGTPEAYRSLVVGPSLVPDGSRYRAPAGKPWKPSVFTFHDWYLLVKQAKVQDQAWEVLKHLTAPEAMFTFNEGIGTTPLRKSLEGKGYLAETQPKQLLAAYVREGQPQSKYPLPQVLNPAFENPVIDAINRKISAREALDQAARAWDEHMAREDFKEDIT